MLKLSGVYAQTTIKSGNWDDPTVWNTGVVPASGSTVIIDYGHVVTRTGSLSLLSLEVRQSLSVTGDVSLTGTIALATGITFSVTGNFSAPGNLNTSGIVTIGGNCIVGGSLTTNYDSVVNFSVGGYLQVGGDITNHAKLVVTGNCTSVNGKIYSSSGCNFSVGGSLSAKAGLQNGGTMNISQSCSIYGGGVTNDYSSTIIFGGNLTVSGGLTDNGTIQANGNFNLQTGDLSISYSNLMVVNGNFTKSGNINLDGTLIVTGNFNSAGGATNINQYNGNFYAFKILTENGVQAGCLSACFPKESCSTCQIKGLTTWQSSGSPGSAYVIILPSWWTNHLGNIGETGGAAQTVCPGSATTFSVAAVTTGTGAMSSNTFEWAVYGGSIIGYNGTSVSSNSGTINGHTACTQVVSGINGTTTYSLTAQWEASTFTGAYVAVRQISTDGCSDGLWSVFYINIQRVAAPTGTATQSFCSGSNPTVMNLSATGTAIKWYSAPTGGTALTSTTAVTTGNYYASQTVNGCESDLRFAVAVTLATLPVATFSYTGSPYCSNASNPLPTFSGGGRAGIFSSSSGLTFVSTATGQINLAVSTPNTYTVTNTIVAAGGCSEIKATTSVVIVPDGSWTGAVSTDWNNPNNWACNQLPTLTSDVKISSGLPKYPTLASGSPGLAKNLSVQSNSSVTVTGNTLQIAGTITNSGTFTATSGTIEMKGSAAQNIGANIFSGNTVLNLTVNNSAGVTLQGPLNVTGIVKATTGNLSSGGNLTLISTAAQTALIDGTGFGEVLGNVTMQRYLPSAFGYKYFSSPFQASTVEEFANDLDLGAAFPTFYKYDEDNHRDSLGVAAYSSGWVKYTTSTNLLLPFYGYAANFGTTSVEKTADITGVVTNGPLQITLWNHNRKYTKGFNLVGNPYPSPIDWNASGWTKANIDNAIYFFNAGNTDQYAGVYSSYVNGISTGNGNNILASMQGFFVHVSNGNYPVNGTLGITNSARINNLNPLFRDALIDNRTILRFAANFKTPNPIEDAAVIYFDSQANRSFDKELDALKIANTDVLVPNIYTLSQDSRQLSIFGIPEPTDSITRIPLGIMTLSDGWINFNAKNISLLPSSLYIYLVDTEKGVTQNLRQEPEYLFYLKAGTYNQRFILVFSLSELSKTVAAAEKIFKISRSGTHLMVNMNLPFNTKASLMISNMRGQILLKREVFEQESVEINPASSSGVYIITVISGNKMQSEKVLIRKDYE